MRGKLSLAGYFDLVTSCDISSCPPSDGKIADNKVLIRTDVFIFVVYIRL